jgi:3',5'-cyclic AMP phosphodiesterase CpdA
VKLAIISDTHITSRGKALLANLQAVRAWVEQLRPDATLHLGDITAEGASEPEQLHAAAALLADWPSALYVLPGNHDVGENDDIARHADEPVVDPARLELYRAALGPDRWRIAAKEWTLVGLNAQLIDAGSQAEAEQDAWLDDVLADAAGPVGVLLHKPLFRNDASDTERHNRYVPHAGRAKLLARLKPHDLRFVGSGHVHQYRRLMVGGVEHVWAPSSAFFVPDVVQEPIGEKVVGAMILELEPDAHSFTCVVPPGVMRHDLFDQTDTYPDARARMLARAKVRR